MTDATGDSVVVRIGDCSMNDLAKALAGATLTPVEAERFKREITAGFNRIDAANHRQRRADRRARRGR